MKIELKSIKHSPSLSEETEAFTANLYVNGKKLGYVENRGNGGCTNYNIFNNKDKQKLIDVENYCKTLPPSTSFGIVTDMTLEVMIDDLLNDYLNKKESKKFEAKKIKDMKKGILVSKEGVTNSYNLISWKGHTLESLLMFDNGRNAIKKQLAKIKNEGSIVLNTNLDNI